MANKIEYQIVGRYMDGKEVTGYHLQSIDTNKSNRFTKEQVYFLVGKGQVSNCSGQIYQDKVLLRGVGISLEDLPIQREDGTLTRTDNIGKVRRGTTPEQAMTQFMLVKAITDGRNTIGYVVANAGGATKNATRQQVFELAKQGKIGNARYQESNGKPILRGVNINLNELPTVTAESLGISTEQGKPQTTSAPNSKNVVQPVVKASAAKAVSKNSATSKNKNGVWLTDSDKAYIEDFKKECMEVYKQINNSPRIERRKIKSLGFSGPSECGPDEDYVVLERFDFGIENLPNSIGGFIELLCIGEAYSISFSYCAVENGDYETETYRASQLRRTLESGWSTAISQFKIKRLV